MNNDVNLSVFPKTKTDALTMLYLQNQDLSKLTPAELVEKFKSVRHEIYKSLHE